MPLPQPAAFQAKAQGLQLPAWCAHEPSVGGICDMLSLVGEEPSVGVLWGMLGGVVPHNASSKRKTGRPALLVQFDG
eukprot:CAMPEP_0183572782 /NCGR_PEP_ID=MMETSP0371-20130417/129352_1 /TAXON_ID=268820 /ORGANISM="Peridinium aciculiferum, Strain PAER-2" /LENGTH=76 /DNA_ID=CAMNT_0025782675 /DNA_START=311 /DNA_END=541 /DNA_ORIENTATION=-